jgi:hypothetical protein
MSNKRSSLFQSNAERLRALQAAVYEAVQTRDKSVKHRKDWQDTSATFFASYDRLAFPGGLDSQMTRLKEGNGEAVEMAVQFLEENPEFFRAGYIKENVLRLLKRVALTKEQEGRLREVVLDRIQGEDRREFRRYCHLAAHLCNGELRSKVAALAESTDSRTRRHAKWVLEALPKSNPENKASRK